MNKRTTAFLLGSVLLCHASLVYGEVPDYNTVVEDTQKENKAVQMFETDDGKGNTVQVAAHQETLYVTARKTGILACWWEATVLHVQVLVTMAGARWKLRLMERKS